MSDETANREIRGVKLCERHQVPAGEVLRVCLPGVAAIAVTNVEGTIYAFVDECTHGAGRLSDGFVDDAIIVCPVHAGEFHIPSGKAMALPVTEDLRTFAVWLDGDAVMADLERGANYPGPS